MKRKIANVVAVAGAILGSTLVASNIGMNVTGYFLFLTSSIAALYILYTTRDTPIAIVLQNLFFVIVNIYGIISHL